MKTKIKTSLPFCLYRVDERVYNLNDGSNTTIKFIKQKIEPSRRTSESQNIEFLRDRWGVDAYSKVEIETEKNFSGDTKAEDAKKFTLNIINDFINLYRYFDNESIHLANLIEEDLFEFMVETDGHGIFSLGFSGGMTVLDPKKITEISNRLEKAINEKYQIPFWRELLLKTHHYFFVGDYRMSILESIIALEFVLATFIKNECKEKGISDGEAEKYIIDVGLSGNLKINIKLLLEKEKLPPDIIFNKCKAGIKIRNAIIHEGRKFVSQKEVEETIWAVSEMIHFLLSHGRNMENLKDNYKQIMKFEEYLKSVLPKIGPNAAFDLSRDARITALEEILIQKNVATREEIDQAVDKELTKSAENIQKMPPLPPK